MTASATRSTPAGRSPRTRSTASLIEASGYLPVALSGDDFRVGGQVQDDGLVRWHAGSPTVKLKLRGASERRISLERGGEVLLSVEDTGEGDPERARAQLVEPVLEQAGMSGVRMVNALGTALVGTALARAEADRGTLRGRLESVLMGHLRASRPYGLGSWEQAAARWARWAGQWTTPELETALRLALDADRALKTSTLTGEAGVIQQLVMSFGVLAQEAAGVVLRPLLAPDIPVMERRLAASTRRLEPGMLDRGVVHDEI